jgi:hypothetical protein
MAVVSNLHGRGVLLGFLHSGSELVFPRTFGVGRLARGRILRHLPDCLDCIGPADASERLKCFVPATIDVRDHRLGLYMLFQPCDHGREFGHVRVPVFELQSDHAKVRRAWE